MYKHHSSYKIRAFVLANFKPVCDNTTGSCCIRGLDSRSSIAAKKKRHTLGILYMHDAVVDQLRIECCRIQKQTLFHWSTGSLDTSSFDKDCSRLDHILKATDPINGSSQAKKFLNFFAKFYLVTATTHATGRQMEICW